MPGTASARAHEALERLARLHPKLIDLGLGRSLELLEKLGQPQHHLPPVIHLAGTNGKGSTLSFLRAMLEAEGKSIHAYTSPHLVRFHERIRLAGTLIDDQRLADLLEEVETVNGDDISKRLGGTRYNDLSSKLERAIKAHEQGDSEQQKDWIEELLREYYDPMYDYQQTVKTRDILFRGTFTEARDFLTAGHR